MTVELNRKLYFLRKLVYNLKYKYGQKVDIYRRVTSDFDSETGKKSVTLQKIPIRNAIFMSMTEYRSFNYTFKHIRPFAMGGYYDLNDNVTIIDRHDLP